MSSDNVTRDRLDRASEKATKRKVVVINGISSVIEASVSAAILVGGRAVRFGGEFKPGLLVGNRTILERQLASLGEAGIDNVWTVGRWPASHASRTRNLPDVLEEQSALGGLYSALLAATTPIVIVVAGDLPLIRPALLKRLTELGADQDAVVPRTAEGWHPLCAAYRRRVAMKLKARLDRRVLKLSEALDDLRVSEIGVNELARIDPDGVSLMNVNTPEDQTAAERHARSLEGHA